MFGIRGQGNWWPQNNNSPLVNRIRLAVNCVRIFVGEAERIILFNFDKMSISVELFVVLHLEFIISQITD